jgi:hypothetical protein
MGSLLGRLQLTVYLISRENDSNVMGLVIASNF